ncbi:MAG: PP2C family serine/threonine-protein phosphatase [Polyangiales bacterium]|nr:serine/threonine-protein phosphatase [Myxococcales bacterium]MCB9660436.1 serine/threonine-protein phosphatase [Sandaracinaceae bacterium]
MSELKVTLSARTDVGRVRGHNEDAYIALDLTRADVAVGNGELVELDVGPQGVLVGVSDGMGGSQAGEIASAMVVQSLDQSLRAESHSSPDDILKEAVERANREVHEAGREPGRSGMGATLTAVLLRDSHAHIASVGDSRAYLLREGRLRQMTRDQSYVQVLLDAGLIKEQEAAHSAFSSIILQSMGQKEDVQVALGRLELRRGDRLFICSDGVTGHLPDADLAELLKSTDSLDVITQRIVDLANERGGSDNITAVVADVSGGKLRRVAGPETVTQTFQVISEFASPVKKSGDAAAPATKAPAVAPQTVDPSGWEDEAAASKGSETTAATPSSPTSSTGNASLVLGFVALVVVAAGVGYWLFAG